MPFLALIASHCLRPRSRTRKLINKPERYDAPANDNLLEASKGRAKGLGYIQTALPMGNGRLGAMFSGDIDTEHLLINDITLWMNSKRGLDEAAQSGTRTVAPDDFETVRKAYRDGKYGTKPGSMESLSTKHLSSTEPLGNYAPFTDVLISYGHDPASVSDYRRSLDSRTGLGTVSYSIGNGIFKRECFSLQKGNKGNKPATLDEFDIPLLTTWVSNEFNAPGGLKKSKGGSCMTMRAIMCIMMSDAIKAATAVLVLSVGLIPGTALADREDGRVRIHQMRRADAALAIRR
ncbi:glycoside hydrolase N-terminal domain-containing protein [Novipirellula sp. SH528]|uniref:glycoside hydrolase N-terminal domain-containing protein n=1 Tax=Novipirellula sp. SH528 TaxID=3454466 RepID=UPI003FA009A0